MHDLDKKLGILGFDNQDVRIYTTLLERGAMSAGRLAKLLKFPRASVYGFLKDLTEKGLIVVSLKSGVKIFSGVEPERINLLFREKIEALESSQIQFNKILPFLNISEREKIVLPRFQLFEGEEGVKHVLKDMLLYSDMETQALWPIKKMVEILSPDFFRYLNKERIKNKLYTRAIWPEQELVEIKKHPYLGVGKKFLREIRIAPKEINFSMGYWIYGNKVAFVSSRKESFGFIIESAEMAEVLLTQFEMIWKQSRPVTVHSKDTEIFLKESKLYLD